MSLGTRIFTWLNGDYVGTDVHGNRYYRGRKPNKWGHERRWVLYSGVAEASKVPPEWHAWLHHITDKPLTESAANRRDWQKEHVPNLTGTDGAYVPPGHDSRRGADAPLKGDYEPWKPA